MGDPVVDEKRQALKKDRDAAGLSGEKDACDAKLPCKKKWIEFHVLDVTDAKKDPKKIKPLKGTRISTKLPGPGDTDVISAEKPVRVNNLDDGTASIKQVAPTEEFGWLFDSLETT